MLAASPRTVRLKVALSLSLLSRDLVRWASHFADSTCVPGAMDQHFYDSIACTLFDVPVNYSR